MQQTPPPPFSFCKQTFFLNQYAVKPSNNNLFMNHTEWNPLKMNPFKLSINQSGPSHNTHFYQYALQPLILISLFLSICS